VDSVRPCRRLMVTVCRSERLQRKFEGGFDGVLMGHFRLIAKLRRSANRRSAPSSAAGALTVMTGSSATFGAHNNIVKNAPWGGPRHMLTACRTGVSRPRGAALTSKDAVLARAAAVDLRCVRLLLRHTAERPAWPGNETAANDSCRRRGPAHAHDGARQEPGITGRRFPCGQRALLVDRRSKRRGYSRRNPHCTHLANLSRGPEW